MENPSLMLSFLITVCNEHLELNRLLTQLLDVEYRHEIVVLVDKSNKTKEVQNVIDRYTPVSNTVYKVVETELNGNFGKFKTFGNTYCFGNWIFQIDADEYIHPFLLKNLATIINTYTEQVDVIQVPRINIVEGITKNHINKWKWYVTKNECVVTTLDKKDFNLDSTLVSDFNLIKHQDENTITYYEPLINFPDYQSRLYRNASHIIWEGAVHEKIINTKSDKIGYFPQSCEYSLYHVKDIDRQVAQNNVYANLIQRK